MDAKVIDLIGQVFNRLTVISYVGKDKYNHHNWNCKCVCGNETVVQANNLKSGRTQSCGCLHIEKITKHGHTIKGKTSSTYNSYSNTIQRCIDPNNTHYRDYGGRGITVCDRWLDSFENFLEDMGERPKGHILFRININGNYSPENCRWATRKERSHNQRNTILLTFNNITRPRIYWIKEWNLPKYIFKYHLSKGRSMEWIYENKVKNKGLVND